MTYRHLRCDALQARLLEIARAHGFHAQPIRHFGVYVEIPVTGPQGQRGTDTEYVWTFRDLRDALGY